MATATAKLVTKVVSIDSVTVTLNEDEFYTLMTILHRVGGCPSSSPRRHTDNVMEAMLNAIDQQVDLSKLAKISTQVNTNSRSIYFDDAVTE